MTFSGKFSQRANTVRQATRQIVCVLNLPAWKEIDHPGEVAGLGSVWYLFIVFRRLLSAGHQAKTVLYFSTHHRRGSIYLYSFAEGLSVCINASVAPLPVRLDVQYPLHCYFAASGRDAHRHLFHADDTVIKSAIDEVLLKGANISYLEFDRPFKALLEANFIRAVADRQDSA